jgi:hypothetical protein
MKVFYIFTSLSLDKRNYERFDTKILLNFFDKIEIYYVNQGYDFTLDKIYFNEKITIHKVKTIFQITKILKIKNNSIYIDLLLPGLNSNICKLILYLKQCKGIVYKLGNIPIYKKKIKVISPFTTKKVLRSLNVKTYNFFNKYFFKKKNIYLCAGTKIQKEYRNLNIVKTHSFDFNENLKYKKKLINRKKFFLYLDQYEHNHPDYNFFGVNKVNVKNFYSSLNNFFDKLEKKYKKEIIIAAHPKSNNHKYFNKRKVIFDKTLELTKNCFVTIAHDSTAISYSIIYQKPIIFIVNNEMIRIDKYKENKIKVFANELNSTLINIDKTKNIEKFNKNFKKINKNAYNDYILKYINNESKSVKKIGEVICDIYYRELLN